MPVTLNRQTLAAYLGVEAVLTALFGEFIGKIRGRARLCAEQDRQFGLAFVFLGLAAGRTGGPLLLLILCRRAITRSAQKKMRRGGEKNAVRGKERDGAQRGRKTR